MLLLNDEVTKWHKQRFKCACVSVCVYVLQVASYKILALSLNASQKCMKTTLSL